MSSSNTIFTYTDNYKDNEERHKNNIIVARRTDYSRYAIIAIVLIIICAIIIGLWFSISNINFKFGKKL